MAAVTALLQVTGGARFSDFLVTSGTISSGDTITVGGTPGVDGVMFPDGTLQTSAATGGAAGDGNSPDAADGDPVEYGQPILTVRVKP